METVKSSAFFADVPVNASLDHTWKTLVDYRAWNPSFADAEVTTVQGEAGAEGEVVHIKDFDGEGRLRAEFYAETVRIVDRHHITWCVYPLEGDDFRNFVDFELLQDPNGAVRFYIQYYSHTRTAQDELVAYRAANQKANDDLAVAFANYVEADPG